MAKKASSTSSGTKKAKSSSGSKSRAVAKVSSGGRRSGSDDGFNAGEAFVKLLQSPLMAELIAVAATAALAALAEQGFTRSEGARGKKAGRAVKAAGKAAATAIGRRLGNEFDEIKKAAGTKAGAKA